MNKSMTEGINGQNAGEKTRQRKGYERKSRERVLGQLHQPQLPPGSPPVSQCIDYARQALEIGDSGGHRINTVIDLEGQFFSEILGK